jgi:hypothetical protein
MQSVVGLDGNRTCRSRRSNPWAGSVGSESSGASTQASQPIKSRYRAPIGAEGRIELGGLHLCDRRNRPNRVNISVKFLVVGSCGNLGRGVEKVQEVEVRGRNPGLAVPLARSSAAFCGFRGLPIILHGSSARVPGLRGVHQPVNGICLTQPAKL